MSPTRSDRTHHFEAHELISDASPTLWSDIGEVLRANGYATSETPNKIQALTVFECHKRMICVTGDNAFAHGLFLRVWAQNWPRSSVLISSEMHDFKLKALSFSKRSCQRRCHPGDLLTLVERLASEQ